MPPTSVRVDRKAPNWPWPLWALPHLNGSQDCSALSFHHGSPTGVAVFEPRNNNCLDLRIEGTWGGKSQHSFFPTYSGDEGSCKWWGECSRGGSAFSVRCPSPLLCFHPVSSVLSQVSRSPAFLHHTAHGLFLLHSLLAPLAELRGDRCCCARGMVSRFAAEGTLLAASHPCLLLTVSPLRVHGPTEKWENCQIKC